MEPKEVEINPKLKELHAEIAQAVFPEDIFGKRLYVIAADEEMEAATQDEMIDAAYKVFREWKVRIESVKLFSDVDQAYAEEAAQMLERLFRDAEKRIKEGEWGSDLESDFIVSAGEEEFEVRRYLSENDVADTYAGNVRSVRKYGRKIIAKIAKRPEDNFFLQNEIRALRNLHLDSGGQTKHLPFTLHTFKTSEEQFGMILPFQVDYYSLEEVRQSERWKNGVPEKHMVWMLNRLLSAAGYAHNKNNIHRKINPQNVLICPRNHNLLMVNWEHSLVNADRAGEIPRVDNGDFGAPEEKAGESVVPSTDLYSIGKCMIYILGGDPKTNEMPDSVNPRIQSFLKAFVLESKWQRVHDAWLMHAELIKLIESLWGERVFLKFRIY